VTEPVTPVTAATVILVRHGEPPGSPWQCFMVRRHIRSDFAADVYVFPGGKVDAGDRDPAMVPYCAGHPGPEAAADPGLWRALRLAAVRELFEEAGVLLAVSRDGALIEYDDERAERFDRYRREIHAGSTTLCELAEREELRFALDRLHPISRWITPEVLTRRFDTYFFLAYMPHGQEPAHDAAETVDSVWIAPADALARYRQGDFPLVFATERHLERMAAHRSIEELVASVTPASLQPVMPRPIGDGGELRFVIPGDEGYES
jgi:8-oxo-dGTP pyrophosphatase MutT (NUDIX family)